SVSELRKRLLGKLLAHCIQVVGDRELAHVQVVAVLHVGHLLGDGRKFLGGLLDSLSHKRFRLFRSNAGRSDSGLLPASAVVIKERYISHYAKIEAPDSPAVPKSI